MPEVATKGRFVWYDLMTTDPIGAVAFYGSLIGWGIEQWEGMETPYPMWAADDATVGGVMELPDMAKNAGAPPHWMGYIATDDVDESLRVATGKGAQVAVPATDIPSIGRFAMLADPQGAAFAMFSSDQEQPDNGGQRIGHVSWHELMTADIDAAWDFYSSTFGWLKTDDMDMGEAGIYRMFGVGGKTPIGGMFAKPAEVPVSSWLFYIKVDDVDRDAELVKALGGKIVNGPMEIPGGDRIVQCMDPQGAAFALHSPKK